MQQRRLRQASPRQVSASFLHVNYMAARLSVTPAHITTFTYYKHALSWELRISTRPRAARFAIAGLSHRRPRMAAVNHNPSTCRDVPRRWSDE